MHIILTAGILFPLCRLHSCFEYECDAGTESTWSSMGWFGQALLGNSTGGLCCRTHDCTDANHRVSLFFSDQLRSFQWIWNENFTEISKRFQRNSSVYFNMKFRTFFLNQDYVYAVADVLVRVAVDLNHLIRSTTRAVAFSLVSSWLSSPLDWCKSNWSVFLPFFFLAFINAEANLNNRLNQFTILFLISFLLLFHSVLPLWSCNSFSVIVAFATNYLLQQGVENATTTARYGVSDTQEFLRSTSLQSNHILVKNYDELTDHLELMLMGKSLNARWFIARLYCLSINQYYLFVFAIFHFSLLFTPLWPFAVHMDFSCARAARRVLFNFHSLFCIFFVASVGAH